MKKLKLAFLWHQHQPYYRIDNEFVLPWVLFHGTKDYLDIPEVLYEFPFIKQTFNFAPSLSLQLDEYTNKKASDKIQRLTMINASNLSVLDKNEIILNFFSCNTKSMIFPNKRYKFLYEKARNSEFSINDFIDQEWLDLQVLYNLVWFGYFSSQRSFIKRLISKGCNYTEEEKKLLIDEQMSILGSINRQYRKLVELGQIELGCSPMYHPILPLLIDSRAALDSMPDIDLPNPLFTYPQDANHQITMGMDYFESVFGNKPNGMWPSEGSISNETLNMLINNGIKWIAGDELVLFNSTNNNNSLMKYFPHTYTTESGTLTIFFRDHNLSDKIGFTYSTWNAKDAANDFVNSLKNIRNSLISSFGEDALDNAVVSVILDGENCWEYYPDNGIPFLRELYSLIQNDKELSTLTFSDYLNSMNPIQLPTIQNIQAGSWINGNFSIWIGDKEDITAWNLLSKTRQFFELHKNDFGADIVDEAYNCLLIAEGSDWFWWYGPEHPTENKPIFDKIFRHYLKKVYTLFGEDSPEELELSIDEISLQSNDLQVLNSTNTISGALEILKQKSIVLHADGENKSMHKTGDCLKSIHYFKGNNYSELILQFSCNLHIFQSIIIEINNSEPYKISIYPGKYELSKSFKSNFGIIKQNRQLYLQLPEIILKNCTSANIVVSLQELSKLTEYKFSVFQ